MISVSSGNDEEWLKRMQGGPGGLNSEPQQRCSTPVRLRGAGWWQLSMPEANMNGRLGHSFPDGGLHWNQRFEGELATRELACQQIPRQLCRTATP